MLGQWWANKDCTREKPQLLNAYISLYSNLLHLFKKKTLLKESVNSVPHHYGQFALSLGKESPYVFSKLTCLIQTPHYYGHYLRPSQCPYEERLTVNVSKKK